MKQYASVVEFLESLSDNRREQVEALRTIIKSANPDLSEHVKWNSPSYVHNGEDRITFNMHYPDRTLVLLHMGATQKENKKAPPIMDDPSGLISWNSDIRGTLSFTSLDDIRAKEGELTSIIQRWLEQ